MNNITNLNQTSSQELKQLLELHGIIIKKAANDHFIIICPSCAKPEAFIYFNKGTRNIKCNRENNCGTEIELWHYIANKQGIDASNNFAMLKYINEILGYEFKQEQVERYNTEREERNKEQKFLTDCNQIFFNALNDSKNNKQVSFSLMYLQQRGYTEEYIKQFCLGFFPNYNDLLNSLVTYYSYSSSDAIDLMTKYFKSILDNNGKPHNSEEYRHRITFTWHNSKGNIAGFSVRKPTKQNLKGKYYYNDNMKTGEVLFNLSDLNIKDKKALVVVEGVFDALTASYLSAAGVRQNYHFVACGKSSLSTEQALLLKNKGYSEVILFLDNDEAGKNFFSSVSKLREHNITAFVALIPDDYKEVKDIDELIRTHPEANLQAIVDNAKYAINVQIYLITKNNSKNHKSLTDREKDKIITECTKLKSSLLMSEHEAYRQAIHEQLGVCVNDLGEVTKLEPNINTANSNNIELEIEKLKLEIQFRIKEIEAKESKHSTIDIYEFRKKSYEIEKLILQSNIAATKDAPNLKTLNNILTNIRKYNHLLTTDYEQDVPYTYSAFLTDINKSPHGLKTGFLALDKHVTIQPASLVFIAGRPSHGKTTMMLNLCRNMIEANPDKSFLFYSYEENREDILLKIILSKSIVDKELNEEEGWTLFEKTKNQLKNYALVVQIQEDGSIKSLSNNLHKACKEVEQWIKDGRLQILIKKPSIEILSSAIIERVQVSEKPVAAIFIDYVQKLNTEEERVNRQQELQIICQTLLNTALDKRINAAIILGAQVNREVKSLDSFNLDNMREAGDIEQDANLVIGVWDAQAAELDSLQQKLAALIAKIEDVEFGLKDGKAADLKESQKKITDKITELHNRNNNTNKNLTIKILKNRNGKKDVLVELSSYPERFLITDVNNNYAHVDAVINSIQMMNIK